MNPPSRGRVSMNVSVNLLPTGRGWLVKYPRDYHLLREAV